MSDDVRPARRWPLVVLAVLAAAAVAFAIGRFSTFGSGASGPNDADAGFARDMQVHHAQAVEMAMELYRKTGDDELRTLAYDIATAQSAQKGEMFDWLVQWGLPQSGAPLMSWMTDAGSGHAGHTGADGGPATDADLRVAMGMATDAELADLRAAVGRDADCLFLELMIRHHEGAIPMAEAVVGLGSVPRVRAVAEGMIANQTAEIDAMTSAQERLGCAG
ncbi:DUF305 domain-containing protein [Microbacterium ulmi]|uniref:DUF305 domain-containing protein n=1 Tax=Microbacterium ulmi TaxID=179095 RepID=A0A7Y2LZH8_9MICO|nr:DUF305 domain-containing protein [Microbacterium ulmi]NII68660.1 uncharacterized protein (DUF305 family) [Microbacterium ulmi]NNH03674.1 DUF305 domain-containing protein [Microbacterium ulmi]